MENKRTTRLTEKKGKIQTRSMEGQAKSQKPRLPSTLALAKKRAKERMSEEANSNAAVLRDPYQTAMDAKDLIQGQTGLVYDERMAEHRCLWDENYPECPERFTEVIGRCQELRLLERCTRIAARPGTEEEVLLKHTQEQFDLLKATSKCADDLERLEELSSHYDAIYIHPSTFELSLVSVGATIELVDAIMMNRIQNGMAIIRPPGHHAMRSEYNGYCFFNNVAIAAQHALNEGHCKRILIVDWDVHHGQGTQRMFYEDDRVMYVSIHRFEFGAFWPNLRESDFNHIGQGPGLGYNVNVPLNRVGMTNGDYLAVFQQLIMPLAIEGEMELTPAFYAHLLTPLMSLAGGKVAVVLEGGYCLKSLAEGAAITLKTLLGDPCPKIEPLEAPNDSIQETILNCISMLRPFWKNLNLQSEYSLSELNNTNPQNDLHKVVVHFEEGPPRPDRFPTRDCYPVQDPEFIRKTSERLMKLQLITRLDAPENRVCYVYDDLMRDHKNLFEGHPERPERIAKISDLHRDYKLFDRMRALPSRMATNEELEWTHSAAHIKQMASYQDLDRRDYERIGYKYNSVFFNGKTFDCARMAAGSVLQVVDEVVSGNSRSGVCIIRPPGHHAESDLPHGFCIFNNVAVAANYARTVHNVRRILIVDWDIHHGNGTQHIFESDPNVLYVSLHRYDYGNFFPKSTDANYDVSGQGKGEGFNVNIPWNRRPMGDAEYLMAFQSIILPIAYEFEPELILVSAGFDAAVGDPLGGYKVSPEAYGIFTHWLSALANGKVIVCLEGGYNVNSISYAMVMCTKALLGDPTARIMANVIKNGTAIETINNVLKVQQKYWKCLRFGGKKLPNMNDYNNSLDNDSLVDRLDSLVLDGRDSSTAGKEESGDVASASMSTPSIDEKDLNRSRTASREP